MRNGWGVQAVLVALAVIAVPFALINSDLAMIGTGLDETLSTLLRLSALLGISLVFLTIVTGTFQPALRRAFRPSALFSVHEAFGVAGLAFILAHFTLLIPSLGEHWSELNRGYFVLGPITLFVLVVTVSTALVFRRRLPHVWYKLHVLNYVVFTAGVVHALGNGTHADFLATKLIFAAYLLVALFGLIYRASSPEWRRRLSLAGERPRIG